MAEKIARPRVELNNKQVEAQLESIEQKAKDLKKQLKDAFTLQQHDLLPGIQKELNKTETEIKSLKRELVSVDSVLKNMNGSTFNQLKKAYETQAKAVRNLSKDHKDYRQEVEKLKTLKGAMTGFNSELTQQQGIFKKLAGGFNNYFGLITAMAASFTGVVFGAKKMVDSFNEFESKVSELSAITGLAGNDLKWLSDQAKELSTSTLEGGIKITKSATDIVDAYKLMGSARPELLKNKEDLNEVTKQALILAEAAKMETAPAVEAVAGAMNQFNLPASEAARVINTLAAGALEGSAEISDLTGSMKNVGAVANDSNMSLEQTVAALEVLATKQLKGEEAGTKLRGALLKMKDAGLGYASGQFNMADAMNEANKKINEQGTAAEKDALKIKYFGAENVTAGTILLNNIGTYESLTKAVTGTNEAIRQASINTSNNSAALEQAKNKAQLTAIEFGEKLAPAMTFSTNAVTMFLKVLMATINFISTHIGVITTITAAIGAYTLAIQVAKRWDDIHYASMVAKEFIVKTYTIAKKVLTGQIKLATIAQQAWNLAQKANPIALLVTLLVAAGVALYALTRQLSSAEKAQKAVNDVTVEAQKNIAAEKIEMEKLMKIAKDEKKSKEERLAAIKKLNEISPEYFGNLTLETINTDAATTASDKYLASLLKRAEAEAAYNALVELEQKRLAAVASGDDKKLETWQHIVTGIRMALGDTQAVYSSLETSAENAKKAEEDYIETKKRLLDIISRGNTAASSVNPNSPTPDLTTDPTNTTKKDKTDSKDFLKPLLERLEEQKKLIIQAQKELNDAGIASLKDGIEKEKAIEEQRWREEQENLKGRIVKKQQLNSYEVEINELTYAQLEIKKAEHLKRIAAIEDDDYARKTLDKLMIAELEAATDEEAFQAKLEILQEQYNQEFALADGNRLKELQAEAKLENDKRQLKLDAFEAKKQIQMAELGVAQQAFGTLRELVGQESKMGQALYLFEQAAAIGQVIFNTGIANAKAVAASPLSFGMPWVGINTASAAISIAGIAGQALKSMGGFEVGGYTSQGNSSDAAGIVHKNEFVANAKATANPSVKRALDIINLAQQNGTINTLDLPTAIANMNITRGYASGGYTTDTIQPVKPNNKTTESGSLDSAAKYIYEAALIFKSKQLVITADAIKRINEIGAEIEVQKKVGSRT
ncbi:MAG: phage tail tape measure protein [Salinivirgaceae bacterium]